MKKFWIAFALGALAGGVAALLYAPQSGSSTRRKLRRGLEDLGDNLGDAADYVKAQAERLANEATKLMECSKEQVSDTLGTAQQYVKGAAQEYAGKAQQYAGKAQQTGSRLM